MVKYDGKRCLVKVAQLCTGGVCYGVLEVLWRGYTHVSMLIVGGICFCILIRLSKTSLNGLVKCLVGGLCITAVEFAAGCIVNLWLCLEVWDYSAEQGHIMGQVCIRFTVLWCGLSAVILPACQYARRLKTACSTAKLRDLVHGGRARIHQPGPADL